MIISARLILKPRADYHRCGQCRYSISGPKLRLFGYAETGDPPYVIYVHPGHTWDPDPKITAALEGTEWQRKP